MAEPQRRYDPFPLTDMQEAYWVGRRDDLALGGVTTHYYCEIDCEGLDLERLGQAWQRVIERHDMLRAVISPDGQQRILKAVPPYPIRVQDLRGDDPDTVNGHLTAIRDSMSRQVLPTDRWPLFDFRASLLSDGRFRLHLNFETLILDARSRNLVFLDWSEYYQDLDASLPALELSFRDFVMAEVALKNSDPYRQAQAYWRARLDTLPPPPELPTVKDPAELSGSRSARLEAQIDRDTWERLREGAIRRGVRPTVLLLAAFADVLRAWSKNHHFVVTLTLFNRMARDPRLKGVVGDYTSSSLVEIDHAPQATFEAQAHLIQAQLEQDLEHSHVSGVEVIRELFRHRGGGFGAVMPVVFTSLVSIDARHRTSSPTGWLGEIVYAITQTPQVYLDYQVRDQSGVLHVFWDVVEELFPAGMLQDMFDACIGFLHRLAGEDGIWRERWSERAPRLVPPEQLAQRAAANTTGAPLSDEMLHTLFAAQVPQRPDQPAVATAERVLTYQDLYRRANQVGNRLRQLGVRPNTLVAVVMEKGWEQVVAVLGILAAGAAYLPLDPTLPPDRLRALLEKGEVSLVLTQPCQDEAIAWPQDIHRLRVGADELGGDDAPLRPVQHPDDLAYVIYTSGSTGFPKGVMIDHRSAVNTILDINERFGVGPGDRVLALASLSFDLSVYDIFGTLAAGGTIVMPEAWGLRDPAHWTDLLSRQGVTIWNSVPILMQLLVEYLVGRAERLSPSLRLALLSGDWIPLNLPDRIKAQGDGVEIISLGGATEGSIWSILYPIDRVDLAWPSVPYGKPMANQTFHVLNEVLAPCPVWVPGQLYIGGAGVARGYWRDPERTGASFITHPATSERLYRTGDLGRYLPDGNIEFLGREDFQVKIQGYRVELGEIEAVLLQQPGVRAAVVTLRGESQEDKRLVAYVVPEPGAYLTVAGLGQALQSQLPDYMLPTSYVLLEALPLTANGKVDRRALPDPEMAEGTAPAFPASERPGLAHRVSSLVCSVLALDELAPDTNLLQLGATSVDMIRIANLLERELQFRPRMNDLYRSPTVDGLVNLYGQQASTGAAAWLEPQWGLAGVPVRSYHLLRDPEERARFKASQPGLRRGDVCRHAVQLEGDDPGADLRAAYLERRSYRQFSSEPIPLGRLGRWLGCLRALDLDGVPKYRYGSAGGLYPVQTYLFVRRGRVQGLGAGTYYYHAVEHRLVGLAANVDLDPDIYDPIINRPIFDQAAFALFLVAQMDAIGPMYGERALHYATLEAGLMTQLVESTAPSYGIGLCQIGNLDFARIRPLFMLGDAHVWLHSLLGGSLAGQASQPWQPIQEPHEPDLGHGGGEFEEGEL